VDPAFRRIESETDGQSGRYRYHDWSALPILHVCHLSPLPPNLTVSRTPRLEFVSVIRKVIGSDCHSYFLGMMEGGMQNGTPQSELTSIAWHGNQVAFVQGELVASPPWRQEIHIVKPPFNLFSGPSAILS
jgi:hypothetical protein